VFGLVLVSASESTADLVTLKFQANKHPPLATAPRQLGPSASSAKSSTGQKPCNALYLLNRKLRNWQSFRLSKILRLLCNMEFRIHNCPNHLRASSSFRIIQKPAIYSQERSTTNWKLAQLVWSYRFVYLLLSHFPCDISIMTTWVVCWLAQWQKFWLRRNETKVVYYIDSRQISKVSYLYMSRHKTDRQMWVAESQVWDRVDKKG